jgi:hypothetical protein
MTLDPTILPLQVGDRVRIQDGSIVQVIRLDAGDDTANTNMGWYNSIGLYLNREHIPSDPLHMEELVERDGLIPNAIPIFML